MAKPATASPRSNGCVCALIAKSSQLSATSDRGGFFQIVKNHFGDHLRHRNEGIIGQVVEKYARRNPARVPKARRLTAALWK
jgi:hypothetical protein